MRFVWLNHWYQEAWAAWQLQGGDPLHGTADYWDVALRAIGHESNTLILNEHPVLIYSIANNLPPDVVCALEVGRFPAATIREKIPNAKVVAFCSHAATDDSLKGYDCIFSSFNWMPDYCKSIGLRCEYMPLAFGRPTLRRIGDDKIERDIPVAFVGGLGTRTWKQGTETMEAIASAIPEFRWWGPHQGLDGFPSLQRTHQGVVYGRDYFRLLHRIKILVNRHGEIARGFAQNTRCYEGPGCGCLIINDCEGATYKAKTDGCIGFALEDSQETIGRIRDLLAYPGMIEEMARDDQRNILANHCYENRLPQFLKVVESL